MGNSARDGRRFGRVAVTYACVVGVGIIIVVAHSCAKSTPTDSSVEGVVQRPIPLQSESATGPDATSMAPSPAATPGAVTSTAPLRAGDGRPVYGTDFGQSDDVFVGWPIGPFSFVNIELRPNGYDVSGSGRHVTLIPAPVKFSFAQIAISTRAKESANSPPGAGFGIYCRTRTLFYEFEDAGAGTWSIIRGNSAETLDPRYVPVVLARGHVSATAVGRNGALSGVCATLPNNGGVRLAMFLNGVQVADLLDTLAESDAGWHAGVVSNNSEVAVSTSTFMSFSQSTFDVGYGRLPPLPTPTSTFVAQT